MKAQKIDLSLYKSVPHPFAAIFKRHKVSRAVVANFLGVSMPYVCNILAGHYKMPDHIKAKLEPLVRQLEEGAE